MPTDTRATVPVMEVLIDITIREILAKRRRFNAAPTGQPYLVLDFVDVTGFDNAVRVVVPNDLLGGQCDLSSSRRSRNRLRRDAVGPVEHGVEAAVIDTGPEGGRGIGAVEDVRGPAVMLVAQGGSRVLGRPQRVVPPSDDRQARNRTCGLPVAPASSFWR